MLALVLLLFFAKSPTVGGATGLQRIISSIEAVGNGGDDDIGNVNDVDPDDDGGVVVVAVDDDLGRRNDDDDVSAKIAEDNLLLVVLRGLIFGMEPF